MRPGDDKSYDYEPVFRAGRWMIKATDGDGEVSWMTCGNPTEKEVWERVRYLRLDDDRIDGLEGHPRKYN